MKQFAFWSLLFFLPFWSRAQQCQFAGPLTIRPNDSLTVRLDVFGVVLNNLASAQQGVCEVRLNFLHNSILDFEVWLTSPAGQTVQLIGPNSTVNTVTLGSRWNIGFVPCGSTALPDPPFQSRWDNQINNFPAGNYAGSYYPFSGCLENFNTGSVNGTWTLKLKTAPTAVGISGRLFGFEIVFCDELGRNCCFADAGRLAGNTSRVSCTGDSSLLVIPQAQYTGARPDTAKYSYTWMLGRDTVLTAYADTIDLRNAVPGSYQVCGLSFDKTDLDSLPTPDGVLRLDSLRAALNSPTPPFCGAVMDTCMLLTVLPPPDTGSLQQAICAGDSLVLGGQVFRTAGVFFATVQNAIGCDSVVRLELSLIPPKQVTIDTQICQGGSVRVGNNLYILAGSYVDTLQAANGCDSIVALNLSVVPLPLTFDTVYICQGGSYTLAGRTFNAAGNYLVTLPATQQCDSLVNLTVVVLSPRAIISGSNTLSCLLPEIILSGAASEPSGQLRFRWEGPPGGVILGTGVEQLINAPGRYVLQVVQEADGQTCAAQTSIIIGEDFTTPEARITGPDTLSCRVSELLLDGSNINTASNARLQWQVLNQPAAPADTMAQYRVRQPGTYLLIARDRRSACADTAQIEVMLDTLSPLADAGPDANINCANPQTFLQARGDTLDSILQFFWTDLAGDTLSRRPSFQVSAAGSYILEVLNVRNGCRDTDLASVRGDFLRPAISLSAPNFACGQDSLTATAVVSPAGPTYGLTWSGPGVRTSGGRLQQVVYAPGVLTLRAENPLNGCASSDSITIGQAPCPPCVEIQAPDTITCTRRLIRLQAALCRPCTTCSFSWTALGGGVVEQGGNTLSPVVSGGGLFRITARDTSGLSTVLDVVVPVDTLPPTVNAGRDTSLTCALQQVIIGDPQGDVSGKFDYFWSAASGPSPANPNRPSVLVSRPGWYFLAQKSNRTGCSGLDSVFVALDTLRPLADAGPAATLTCAMPRASLDGSGSASGFSIQYAWDALNGGRILAGSRSATPLIDAAGLYRLTVRDTMNGCAAQDSVQVDAIFQGPQIAPIPDQVLNCQDTVRRVEAQLPDNRAYAFRWCLLQPNGDSLCQASLAADMAIPGVWLFELQDLATGCKSFEQINVRMDTMPPQADAGRTDTLRCNRPSLRLNGATALSAGQFEVQWTSTSGNLLGGGNTLQPEVAAPGWYRIQVRSLLNFCTATDSVEVVEDNQRPQAFAGRDTSLTCQRTSLRLQGTTSFPTNNLDWTWTTADGRIAGDASSLNPLINRGGTYIFTVRNRVNGCEQLDTVRVLENTLPPRATLTSEGPFLLTCRRDTLSLDATPSLSQYGNALTYTWRPLGTTGSYTPLAPERILVQQPGRYRLTVRDAGNGCADSLEVQVDGDFILPLIQLQALETITCTRPEIALEAWVSGPERRYMYTWTTPDGAVLPEDTATVRVAMPGQYRLLVTNMRTGCFAEQAVNVREDKQSPLIQLAAFGTLDCDTPEIPLDASASRGRRLTFSWQALEGRLNGSANTPIATVSEEGRYILILTDGENGCEARDTVEVEASGNFIEGVELELIQPGCGPGQGGEVLVAEVRGGKAPFRFRLDNRLSDAAGRFRNVAPGTYLFSITDSEGCTWSEEIVMEEPQRITVELGPDTEIYRGDSVLLEAQVFPGADGVRFQWTGGVEMAPDSATRTVRPLQTTTYQVRAIAPNGCDAVDQRTIRVLTDLPVYMPTAFSPNGDGQNDVFFVQSGNRVRQVREFQIFDRWGTQVFGRARFAPNDPSFGWDGQHKGRLMPSGVYVYYAILEMEDGREEMVKGEVILLR